MEVTDVSLSLLGIEESDVGNIQGVIISAYTKQPVEQCMIELFVISI